MSRTCDLHRQRLAFLTASPAGRNVAILELIARGLNNAEITRRLVVSDKTVRNHVSNIFTKLHVADRAQAIVRARESGLGGSDRD